MSDSSAVTVASLGPGSRPVFTAAQWQELEHQALIFKYLKAGLPVPAFLLAPIRKNLQLLSPTLLHHSALSYCSYYGKRMDLEPGRCRRTDGKKWRCSKDAHPDSKYCERHMNRSRNRSRKPVESQTTSCSMSTVASDIARGTSSRSGTFGTLNFPSIGNSEVLCFGSNASQWQMESIPFGINGKDYRNSSSSWSTAEADKQCVSSQTSGNIWNHGISSAVDGTWHPVSQIPPNPFPEPRNSALLLENNPQLQIHQEFELQPRGPTISKQQQQHYVFAKDFGSPGSMKQEYQSLQPPFEEWSHRKDSGSCFDQGSNKNSFPIQLSMAIPVSPKSFARSVHPRSGNALFPSSERFLRPSNQSDSNVG